MFPKHLRPTIDRDSPKGTRNKNRVRLETEVPNVLLENCATRLPVQVPWCFLQHPTPQLTSAQRTVSIWGVSVRCRVFGHRHPALPEEVKTFPPLGEAIPSEERNTKEHHLGYTPSALCVCACFLRICPQPFFLLWSFPFPPPSQAASEPLERSPRWDHEGPHCSSG